MATCTLSWRKRSAMPQPMPLWPPVTRTMVPSKLRIPGRRGHGRAQSRMDVPADPHAVRRGRLFHQELSGADGVFPDMSFNVRRGEVFGVAGRPHGTDPRCGRGGPSRRWRSAARQADPPPPLVGRRDLNGCAESLVGRHVRPGMNRPSERLRPDRRSRWTISSICWRSLIPPTTLLQSRRRSS